MWGIQKSPAAASRQSVVEEDGPKASIAAGIPPLIKEFKSILETLEEKQKKQDKDESKPAGKNNEEDKKRKEEKKKGQEDDLKTGVFTVKEVKPGKSEGTVWAKVTAEDGKEYKVCAKNGIGETLSGAVGKKARIKYRPMGEGKLYGAVVEIIQK